MQQLQNAESWNRQSSGFSVCCVFPGVFHTNFHGWRRVWGEPGENRGGTGGEPGENRGRPKEPGENRGHLGREPGRTGGFWYSFTKSTGGEAGAFVGRTGGEPGENRGGGGFSLKRETQLGT